MFLAPLLSRRAAAPIFARCAALPSSLASGGCSRTLLTRAAGKLQPPLGTSFRTQMQQGGAPSPMAALLGAAPWRASQVPLLQLLSGARRHSHRKDGVDGRGARMGGARAQPIRAKPKLKRPGVQTKYKLKTHKGAMKRFYQKGDGTFMHKAAGKKHLQAGTSRRRQTLRKMAHRPVTTRRIIKKLKRLMPYGSTTQPATRWKISRLWDRPADWKERVAAAELALSAKGKTADPKEAKPKVKKAKAGEAAA